MRRECSLTWFWTEGKEPQLDALTTEELHELEEMALRTNPPEASWENYLRAWRFKPEKQAEGDAWEALVDEVLTLLMSRGLSLTPQQIKPHKRVLRVLLANLLSAYSQDRCLFIRYSRRECDADGFPFNAKIRLIDALLEAGLIVHKMGVAGDSTRSGRQSRMRATSELTAFANGNEAAPGAIQTNVPLVIVRDKDGRDVEFKETSTVRIVKAKVRLINQALQKQAVGLALPTGVSFPTDNNRLPIDTTRNSVCRIFADPKLNSGGRFYRHWVHEIKSHLRQYLTLNGEPTVELDYGSCQPNLLYAREGLPACNDAYALPGNISDRDVVKIAMSVLLFHDNEKTAPNAVLLSAKQNGHAIKFDEAKSLLAALREKHGPIAKYFHKGFALSLQHEDSCIAEEIMLNLIKQGIPFIPIHDSFVVPERHEAELRRQMTEVYRKRTGQLPIIKAAKRSTATTSPAEV